VSRARSVARVILGLVVAASFISGVPGDDIDPAAAQAAPALGGVQGRASASGVYAVYAPIGLLPISPLAEVGAPDALATIASGTTFARASILDPGDLLANPDAVLALLSPQYPAGSLPAYPFRISATTGIGPPTAESNPAPGMHARVGVDASGSTALASMPAVDAPAVARFGSINTLATTRTDGGSVTVTARTEVSGINVLGMIVIDTLVSEVSATSTGAETTLTGGTTITGASLFGQSITIDADGIHVGAPTNPDPLLGGLLRGITQSLADLLVQAGIKVSAVGPVELSGGTSGQLAATGMRIDLELSEQTLPALATLAAIADSLPPLEAPIPGLPGIEDVLAAARARHLVAVDIGRAAVSLTARPSASRPSAATPTPSSPGAAPPVAQAPSLVGATPTPTAPAVLPPTASVPTATEETPATTFATGVGALVLLALLALPFAGRGLTQVANAVLAPNQGGACPREER
jgi:hypothetical protein